MSFLRRRLPFFLFFFPRLAPAEMFFCEHAWAALKEGWKRREKSLNYEEVFLRFAFAEQNLITFIINASKRLRLFIKKKI